MLSTRWMIIYRLPTTKQSTPCWIRLALRTGKHLNALSPSKTGSFEKRGTVMTKLFSLLEGAAAGTQG